MQGLISSWDVLTTMTPADYMSFRAALDTSSGFQSFQFRELEFVLGNRNAVYLEPFRHEPERFARLERRSTSRRCTTGSSACWPAGGCPSTPSLVERDWSVSYRAAPQRRRRLARSSTVDPSTHWDLYELGEDLLDLEDAMRQWRLRHVTTVERIIGLKAGTGGTAGVPYLRERLQLVLFPELWDVRTEL